MMCPILQSPQPAGLRWGEEEAEDGEKRGKLRPNNGFLHDNVD